MSWLAFDIGGANLKVADGVAYCASEPFALWREPCRLTEALEKVIAAAPACDHIAATMTGELADCFQTKEDGVRQILQALATAGDGRAIRVYQTNGRLVSLDASLSEPLLAAAANWHGLARFASRFAPAETALLIDVGSTTTDIIPILAGQPRTVGHTDTERLLSGELVYTGVERNPVCAIAGYLPYRQQLCPVAQELFATSWDVYLTLSEMPEERENRSTADGRPATREAARARLARSICADPATFEIADAMVAAEAVRRHQAAKIAVAVAQVIARLERPVQTVIVSGRGEFVARRVIDRMALACRVVSLADQLGAPLSRCATAHALAVLAREGLEE